MPNHEGPTEPGPPSDPSDPTQPIRPTQPGKEPIPERVRRPIVVPRPESTIAGLPRAFAVAAAIALVIALVAGFLIGRSVGGDGEPAGEAAARGGGRCGKALTLSQQLIELQKLAVTNRTQLAQAIALEDEGQVAELTSAFEELAPALQEAEAGVGAAIERCRNRRGKGEKGERGGAGKGGRGNA